MKSLLPSTRPLLGKLFIGLLLPAIAGAAGKYRNFDVAVYIPVGVVRQFENPAVLQKEWETISRQLKVDKVYIESQRDRLQAGDTLLEQVKQFFLDHGVNVAGGVTFSDNTSSQFRSFCYTNAADREYVKRAAETAARHFDEVILDDFFFVTTKDDSDLAAKGGRSWTRYRLDLMDEAAQSLVVGPARAVNPKVRVVVKFPNWYEHFQGLGFDLEKEPQIFDGIYTGTETRDPVITDQFLQQYESYQIMRYFENIAPGRNGGGWVDTFGLTYLDRYPEQLWNTLFAKAREMTLFNWAALLRPFVPGARSAWENLPTSFNYRHMLDYRPAGAPASPSAPTMARVAGYSLAQVDAFLGKLGNPTGIKSYKPPHSTGEDFLHNYLGMIGIPIDLHPTFPTAADVVLLTESAKADPDLVAKIKGQLAAGKSVVITSGLLRALQGKGIEDIVEVEYTEQRFIVDGYSLGFGSGDRSVFAHDGRTPPILFPQIRFLTNDAWSLASAMADSVGYPLLLMDRYSRGALYIWTIPDNFHHLYRLPPAVTGAIKDVVMKDFFVRIDGPSQVALFAYDNGTFIVESYLDREIDVRVSMLGSFSRLRDLVTDATLKGAESPSRRSQPDASEKRTVFDVHLLPHSYSVFAAEK